MNFREVNKKLNDLKQSGNKQALEQFRNTKISEINFLQQLVLIIKQLYNKLIPNKLRVNNMLVFIIVVVALIVITGLCAVFAENDNNRVHYATWLEMIETKERLGWATKEELDKMKERALVLKKQYNIKD